MSSIELFYSDTSSESEEENFVELRRQRRRLRDQLNPLEMDSNMFKKNFRLNKDVFLLLLYMIDDKLPPGSYNSKIPNVVKLCVTLRFCAQGSYQLGIGNEGSYGVAQSTVSSILEEMLNVLEENLCPQFIDFNYSSSETDAAKSFFYNKCGIPGIIGAIDGTHVKLVAPKKELQHLYYNRKGFFSINAMIVCDHKMMIRSINAKHPGSCHDSSVFANSDLKSLLQNKYENGLRNTWLLGDAGYALQPYLLTPFRSADPESVESRYNTMHAKGRNIVERVIGVLKNRWRCLLGARALHYSPDKATKIINVCAALHNVCVRYNVGFDEELVEIPSAGIPEDNAEDSNIRNEDAEAIRLQIAYSL